jgi:lysophospholipase L1-like esterase
MRCVMPPRLTKALLGLGTALVLLVLAEGVVRLSLTRYLEAHDAHRHTIEDLHRAYSGPAFEEQGRSASGVRRFGPSLRTLRPSGFDLPKPATTLRVILVGDSTAWGLIGGSPADAEHRGPFGPEIERQLAEVVRPRRAEVINMGLPGAISEVALALVRQSLTFQPDAIVAYVGINDSNLDLIEPTLVPGVARQGWLRRHLRLADVVAHMLTKPRAELRLDFRRLPVLEANLRRMLELARGHRVPFLFCLPVGREGRGEPDVQRVRDRVRQAAGSGAHLVDIPAAVEAAALRRGVRFESFYSDDVHPNRQGYAVYAEAIVAALRKLESFRSSSAD